MAKYKVLKKFRDKEENVIHEVDAEIEMTVKRADELNKKLAVHGEFLERIEEEDAKEVKEEKEVKPKGKK